MLKRYDPVVFWVDYLGRVSIYPFINNQDTFFKSLKSMIYATCLIIMLILSQMTIIFPDFPANIWVALLVVYAFRGSMILQSGLYSNYHCCVIYSGSTP